jgi:hypothetical protein
MKKARKLLAFLLTDLFLVGAAFLVKNGNFSALSTGLVAALGVFTTAHAVTDWKHGRKEGAKDDAC